MTPPLLYTYVETLNLTIIHWKIKGALIFRNI